jgi:hypothetical protein
MAKNLRWDRTILIAYFGLPASSLIKPSGSSNTATALYSNVEDYGGSIRLTPLATYLYKSWGIPQPKVTSSLDTTFTPSFTNSRIDHGHPSLSEALD